ncbi:unnamed protein product, partial [Ranitomeya imitator]
KEIVELKSKISSTEQQLRSTSSPEDFKGLKDKVDKTVSDLRDNLQIRKRNKFLRDTEDYRNNQNNVQAEVTKENEEGATDTDQNSAEWRPDPSINEYISPLSESTGSEFTLKSLDLRTHSSFQPPHIYHPVETYIELVKNDVKKVLESIERGNHHVRHNLSVEEKRALSTLKDNKQIIIKPADKGGFNYRDYYMQEIRAQLGDLDTYQPIGSNPTFEISREIKDLVTHYATTGTIDTKLGEFLVKQHPVTPVFYTLPKIHKHPLRPPGRPIVASTESLLSPLAITLENFLSPLVPRIRSYLKDTTDFITSLKNVGRLPTNCLLVSMDVNSLYTSIRHQDGIESVMSFLSSHTNFSIQQQKFCKDFLTLVLTRNFFIFEDQFFIQRKGTAMGSNMAPPYANIFMDHFELTYVYTHPNDIFLIWTGDIETLCDFHRDLNSSLPGLTFSLSHDPVSMNFLDTRVIINEHREVETDLFVKSTDRNSLLKYDSCHPHHIKRALPKSQHVRVDRIVSNPEISHIRHQEMNEKFRIRGYPEHVLTSNRDTTRPDICSRTPRMAFVSTFHPLNHLINKCILQHWDILRTHIHNKRCSNIKDHLVRADVGPSKRGLTQGVLTSPHNGTFPCLSCHQCSNVLKGDSFTHPRSGKRFPIKGQFNCNSSFVVYLIKCPCGLGYVGETTQHIRDRISKHKSTIRCGRTLLPFPAHFLQNNHSVAQLRFQIIDHVPVLRRGGDRIKRLKERESFWIYTLQTLAPHGLNREYEFTIHFLSGEKNLWADALPHSVVSSKEGDEPLLIIPLESLRMVAPVSLESMLPGKTLVPPNLLPEVLYWAHTSKLGGHFGTKRTTGLLARHLGLLYDEPNSVDQAEKILLALCQGQEAAELYCQKFRKWSVLTKWNEDALAAIFRKGLSESIKDVKDVFDEPKSSSLPPHRDCDCAIDLIPGCKFPEGRLFNLSVPEHTAMWSYIKESLEKGHIRPSSSPLGAGFFFVAKKDGSLRPCLMQRSFQQLLNESRKIEAQERQPGEHLGVEHTISLHPIPNL